jgi:hypothetical protein
MKFKLPIFLSLSIIFSLSLLPSLSIAQSIECPVGALFNIITGQPCQSSTPASIVPIVNTSLTCLTFTKNLSFGQRSADIIKLQQFLKTQGDLAQSVVPSTNFGPATLKAIQKFQLRTGIVSSARTVGYGNVGPNTRTKIKALSCTNNVVIGNQVNNNGLLGNLNTNTNNTNNTNTNNTNTNNNTNNTQSTTTTNQTTYTITATAGTGGAISPSGAVSVASGASRAFSIAANSGYQISQVLVNNSNQGAISSYTFSNVTANSTIAVSFSQVQQNQGSSNQCNDGIDNDGDGLVDWQYDLGCYGSNDTTESSGTTMTQDNGWTVFEKSPDTKIVYVSYSTGNDSNNGLTPSTPVKTIAAGLALLRDGFPDWLLLKRGDTWPNNPSDSPMGGSWQLGGRSATERFVMASYGSSTVRPIIKAGAYTIVYTTSKASSNIALVGLDFYSNFNDQSSPDFDPSLGNAGSAIGLGPAMDNLLIEDCISRYFLIDFSISPNFVSNNFALRRSIIVDAYEKVSGHSQGLFISNINGVTIEDNVFDHNGWNETWPVGRATQFNHNIYMVDNLTGPIVVRNNIFARASLTGIQGRAGGDFTNNLFAENPIGMNFSRGAAANVGGGIHQNVFLGARITPDGTNNGSAIQVLASKNALFDGNIISGDTWSAGTAIEIDGQKDTIPATPGALGHDTSTIQNNIIYHWGLPYYSDYRLVANGVGGFSLKALTVQNNDFQFGRNPTQLIYHGTTSIAEETWSSNRYFDDQIPPNNLFTFGSQGGISFASWQSQVESTAINQQVSYPDPTRTVGSYNTSLGGAATTDAFLTRARQQSKYNWSDSYTANAVNNYIRAGFGR